MARESSLTRGGRVALGGLVEAVKATAGGGTKNARGDFTVDELRALAPESSGAVIDRCVERGAQVLEVERRLRALARNIVQAVRHQLDDRLTLRFDDDAVLELPPTGWLLRADGEELVRGADEPAWALEQLRALEGTSVTHAGFRRRDQAVALELAADPFAPAYELLIRGRPAPPWALTTRDGVRVGPRPGRRSG